MGDREKAMMIIGEISLAVPTVGGMINMRIDSANTWPLQSAAYAVVMDGLKRLDGASAEFRGCDFLNPDHPHYAYFIYRVTQVRNTLQGHIPGCPCHWNTIPSRRGCYYRVPGVLSSAEAAALIVARFGPCYERFIVNFSEEQNYVNHYTFFDPQDKFHAYYKERVEEYRMFDQTPIKVPGLDDPAADAAAAAADAAAAAAAAAAAELSPPEGDALTVEPYLATPWNGNKPLDEGFRLELEVFLREKWKLAH